MKRRLLASGFGLVLLIGAAGPAAADPPDYAAAYVVHRCENGVGYGSTTVRGEVKAEYVVPAPGSHGIGPCPQPGDSVE
jgi:hypothetical protein